MRIRSRGVAIVAVAAIVSIEAACRHDLPPTLSSAAAQYGPDVVDENMQARIDACAKRLDELRDAARDHYSDSDRCTLVGGTVGAVGGGTAAIAAAVSDEGRTVSIISAAVGALGAIIAVFSKSVEDPQHSLSKRAVGELHYMAGLQALNVLQYEPGLSPTDRQLLKRYALDEFTACLNGAATAAVPPLPTRNSFAPVSPSASATSPAAGDAGIVDAAPPDASPSDNAAVSYPLLNLSFPECVAACRALCERKKSSAATSAVVGHFCSETGEGWRACVDHRRCNDRVWLMAQ